MPKWMLAGLVAVATTGIAACGSTKDDPAPTPVLAPGTPQGPTPRAGLRGGDLLPGATLTGTPARALATVGDTVYASGISWVAPFRGSTLTLRGTGRLARAFGTNGQISDAVGGRTRRRLPRRRLRPGRGRDAPRPRARVRHGPARPAVPPAHAGLLRRARARRRDPLRRRLPEGPRTGCAWPAGAERGDGQADRRLRDGHRPRGHGARAARRHAVGRRERRGAQPRRRRAGRRRDREAGAARGRRGAHREAGPGVPTGAAAGGRAGDHHGAAAVPREALGGRSGGGPALSLLDPKTGATAKDTSARGAVRELVADRRQLLAVGDLGRRGGGRDYAQAFGAGGGRATFHVVAPTGGGVQRPTAYDGVLRGRALWLGGLRRTSATRGPGLRPQSGFVAAFSRRTGARLSAVRVATPDGPVNALTLLGGRVVAGGDFAATAVRRQDLAAFDATTGVYAGGVRLPETADADALLAAGGRLWIADGKALLVVDPATGSVVRRIALPTAGARLATAGGRVFAAVRGLPGGVAAYAARTGVRARFRLPLAAADDRFAPALLGDGTTLWVGGSFDRAGPAKTSVLKLDPATGRLDARFDPHANGPVYAMVRDGERLFLAGFFTRVGELRRRGLAAVRADTGAAEPDFEPMGVRAGDATTLARLGNRLLVTGVASTPRAVGSDGRPARATVKGTALVTAMAPGPKETQLVAGRLRAFSTVGAARQHGVVLPPR